MNDIIDDKRDIEKIVFDDDSAIFSSDIQSIVAYGERGEMGYVPWFAITINGDVKSRINGKYVASVVYKEESEEE